MLMLLVHAAIIHTAAVIARILQPKDFPFNLPTSGALQGKQTALHADSPARRHLDIFVFPMPPMAFHRVGIFCIHKILDGTIQVKLATVEGASAQGAFFGIQFVCALAFQGFDGCIAHRYQVLFGRFADVGDFSEFAHIAMFSVDVCEDKENRGAGGKDHSLAT